MSLPQFLNEKLGIPWDKLEEERVDTERLRQAVAANDEARSGVVKAAGPMRSILRPAEQGVPDFVGNAGMSLQQYEEVLHLWRLGSRDTTVGAHGEVTRFHGVPVNVLEYDLARRGEYNLLPHQRNFIDRCFAESFNMDDKTLGKVVRIERNPTDPRRPRIVIVDGVMNNPTPALIEKYRHRAQAAGVAATNAAKYLAQIPCPDCAHTATPGQYVGLSKIEPCRACNGKTTIANPDAKPDKIHNPAISTTPYTGPVDPRQAENRQHRPISALSQEQAHKFVDEFERVASKREMNFGGKRTEKSLGLGAETVDFTEVGDQITRLLIGHASGLLTSYAVRQDGKLYLEA